VQNGCFVMETVLAVATGSQASPITVDADAFHSGDVGEWDPFINILHQGQGFATSGASSQVPPSRTGSTFTALVKLMTILRQTSQPGRHPEASAADLRLWEVSLAADLRGAMTAQGRAPHPPVPSQLNLQSWYSILCCTIASLRQGLTGSNNTEAPDNPTMQVVDALHSLSAPGQRIRCTQPAYRRILGQVGLVRCVLWRATWPCRNCHCGHASYYRSSSSPSPINS
jgi:hypothetical protein